MGAATPKAIVEEMGRRFTAGDREGAFGLLSDDVRVQQPASLPHGGWHEGHEGMAEMGVTFGRFWDRTIANTRVFGCGDVVLQVTTQTWTSKATGRSATVDVVELLTVAKGLVSEIRVFQQDTHLLLETLQPS